MVNLYISKIVEDGNFSVAVYVGYESGLIGILKLI